MVDAFSKKPNETLQNAGGPIGLVAYGALGNDSKTAAFIDAAAGFSPTIFTSGLKLKLASLSGLKESGAGVLEAIKDLADTP